MARQEWEQLARDIASRVKTLRVEAGLSQEKLARRMEMSRQTVFEIEHGTRLAEWDTYGKLADALGVAVSDVLPLSSDTARYVTRHSLPHNNSHPPKKIAESSRAA